MATAAFGMDMKHLAFGRISHYKPPGCGVGGLFFAWTFFCSKGYLVSRTNENLPLQKGIEKSFQGESRVLDFLKDTRLTAIAHMDHLLHIGPLGVPGLQHCKHLL